MSAAVPGVLALAMALGATEDEAVQVWDEVEPLESPGPYPRDWLYMIRRALSDVRASGAQGVTDVDRAALADLYEGKN